MHSSVVNISSETGTDLTNENVAKGAVRACDSSFHFFEEKERRVVERCAVAAKDFYVFREKACKKSDLLGTELLV